MTIKHRLVLGIASVATLAFTGIPASASWVCCNRTAYAEGEHQVQFDILSGNEARGLQMAKAEFNLALVSLENTIEAEVGEDFSGSLREYTSAVEHARRAVGYMQKAQSAHEEMIRFLSQVGPEPDFATALRTADYEAMYDRLLSQGLIRPERTIWEKVVASTDAGVTGLVEVNRQSLDAAFEQMKRFHESLEDSTDIVRAQRFRIALETGEIPVFVNANRALVSLTATAEECAQSALIAKEVRGTAGWTANALPTTNN